MAAPHATTEAPTLVGKDFATMHGVLTDTGGLPTEVRFLYRTRDWPTWYASPWTEFTSAPTLFFSPVTGLTPQGMKEYMVQARNADGQFDALIVRYWMKWRIDAFDGQPFFPYNYTATGPYEDWVLFLNTDVHCHMTMHVDNNVPYRKTGEHYKRGIVYMHTPLTFFRPEWHLDQVETGDSLWHTFHWHCKKPYGKYTFQGTATTWGRLSPSKTPFYYIACKPTPPPIPTLDKCLGPWSGWHFAQWWNAAGQTFCPDHDYRLARLHLGLNQYSLTKKGWLRVMITRQGGTCWSEQVLWSTDIYSTTLPDPNSYTLHTFNTGNIPLTKDTWYRIVVHSFGDWGSFWQGNWTWHYANAALAMWHGNNPDCYTRGTMVYGCNFRTSSGGYTTAPSDLLFQCDEAPD
ncbi:hypothetical protein ES708_25475 [subsurface metagenome]